MTAFDRLLKRLRRRVAEAQRDAGVVLSQAVSDEAAELWKAAQPADARRPTADDNARLALAAQWLAWLHSSRSILLPEEPGRVERARAIVHLAPWADGAFVPDALRDLLGPAARPDLQAQEAGQLLLLTMRTGETVVLDASIALHEIVLPTDHPHRGTTLSNAAAAYWTRYERAGATADLDRAIDIGTHAAAGYPGDPNRPTILSNLGAAYLGRHERTGNAADLDRAVEILGQATAVLTAADPNRPIVLTNLGVAYQRRFEDTGNLPDLDRGIDAGQQAVAAAADPDGVWLTNLSMACRTRYERSGDPAYLERAIELGNRAITATAPAGHHALILSNLGVQLHDRFERWGDVADLDRAVEIHERAVAATPDGHPARAGRLNNLGTACHARFGRTGDLAALGRAIETGEQALAGIPADHPLGRRLLANLGIALQARFERTGSTADLDQAIGYKERSVATDRVPDATSLSNLGFAYLARHQRTGDRADLDRAIETGERSIAETPLDHPDRAVRLGNLGNAYRARFERTGALDDLSRGIEHAENAVATTPDDHPGLASQQANLGQAHQERFLRTGDAADLDRAVDLGRLALARTPAGHPDAGGRLNNLGTAFQRRFTRVGSSDDLERAIDHKERALAAIPEDHPDRARYASNLSVGYLARFHRAGDAADLERTLEAARLAVTLTPDDHPELGRRLNNLGSVHLNRYDRDGGPSDVDAAVEHLGRGVARTPDDHPGRVTYRANLGRAHRVRFEHSGDRADLDAAVGHLEHAVAATPDGHPNLAGHLANLARGLQARFDLGVGGPDPARLELLAGRVLAATTSSPLGRVRAGHLLGRLASAVGEHRIAARLLDDAVALLPSVPSRETLGADQEHRMGGHLGLVGEAIAAHCALDDPIGAVLASEQGRGVLLAAQLDSRTDVSALEAAHPEPARRFRAVRERLNAADPPDGDVVGERKPLWAEYDALLAGIRRLPGWDRFLLAPDWAELRPAAGGTVVLLNSGRRRSDAVVIPGESAPVLVPLPELRLAEVERQAAELSRAMAGTSSFTAELRRQRVVSSLLGWLWDTAVGPVLERIPATGAALPRVWWMPAGLLGLLPLHAAEAPGQPGALDRAVSSYAPTLRALARAHARPAAAHRRQLAVALERTPGLPDLPATAAEAAGLPASELLMNEQATADEVLHALARSSWAHFACHADTDPDAPSRGGLHLHDGALPIARISRLELTGAELAYLSACSTGQVGRRHANEVIHLASAFQLAGFRHTVASLWPLGDQVAATAAERFYRAMPDVPDADHAAPALHEVTRSLRAERPDRPHLWAPLIHSGPR